MARDASDSTIVESRDDLVALIASGSKPEADWRIGTEHEKFGFNIADLSPVPYEGPHGIERILRLMEGLLGWQPIEDRGLIIGLVDPVGGGAISLEPGGQFELSGAPLETIHQTCRELHAHLAQVRECAEPLGIGFIGLGTSPIWSLDETPVMPKSRYEIMARYMPKVGTRGLDMMFRTSTVQVNLDFADEADMVKKMRVSLALQPIATALFANSPFIDNKVNGLLDNRAEIWRDTDNQRSGLIPFAFEDGFGFERYVDWALDVPLYFVKRGDRYHDVAGQSFRDLLRGELPGCPGERATLSDWNNHLTTLFPDVRLKKYIEMRGADAGPWRTLTALPAFWVGLLYDRAALDAAWDLVKDWTADEREALRDAVPVTALKTPFRNRIVRDIARDVLELAQGGLTRRGRKNADGVDESVYLQPLQEVVASGETPAERLLREYATDWNGDIGEVFRRHAY
ncbi:glutamate--cysteine ligase [Kaistia dalseonensis]|uniref:Glutamate--cysteine ligase n=1 Tax=Kaistia dalseonensis TaxID=410840 RepID=A0ABU0H6Z5_9HYPH|nr:glutamate--cysteine ligase [Kaistia dalseonensis]MCX5495492.1 glutamate--cysteine ligase [Kaistia dalseonensis]MDQ0438083.1 glutamate--cysteine ligase [Kaistia dalseonensis]